MVTKKKDRNESNCLKIDEDLNETKVNVKEFFFQLIFNQTTIDCNQFDIEILKNFFWVFQTKIKRSFFERGKKTKCSIKKNETLTSLPSMRLAILVANS